MPRFIAPIAIAIALLGLSAAPAVAGKQHMQYAGQTKSGSEFSSRSVTGPCSVETPGSDAVLTCSGKGGSARVTYLFALPQGARSVDLDYLVDKGPGASVASKRVSDTQFRVTVTVSGKGSARVEWVQIHYYRPV